MNPETPEMLQAKLKELTDRLNDLIVANFKDEDARYMIAMLGSIMQAYIAHIPKEDQAELVQRIYFTLNKGLNL